MGKVSISLPDELVWELLEGAKKGNRGLSAEVRMRLDRDRLAHPTGVAAGRSTVGVEFSAKSEIGLPVKLPDDLLDPGVLRYRKPDGKFEGVSELAKKIASENPGVVRASGLKEGVKSVTSNELEMLSNIDAGENLAKLQPECEGKHFCECAGLAMKSGANRDSVEQLERDCRWVTSENSEKKRPDEPKAKLQAKVEMVKGFWRERYPSEKAARDAAAAMGWSQDEYEIKPLA